MWVEETSMLSTTNEKLTTALNYAIKPEEISRNIYGRW